ncbi:hypothetical protein D3C80_1838500 [compost metagenome]
MGVAGRRCSAGLWHCGQRSNQSMPWRRASLRGMTVRHQPQAGQLKVKGGGGIGMALLLSGGIGRPAASSMAARQLVSHRVRQAARRFYLHRSVTR